MQRESAKQPCTCDPGTASALLHPAALTSCSWSQNWTRLKVYMVQYRVNFPSYTAYKRKVASVIVKMLVEKGFEGWHILHDTRRTIRLSAATRRLSLLQDDN